MRDNGRLLRLLASWPLTLLSVMAPLAIIFSTILRRPVSFALLGIALTRASDGTTASRRRCFARAMLAWLPVIAGVLAVSGWDLGSYVVAIPLTLLALP